jgi:predicted enzyme related to lactoylglutathione lyase
VSDGRVSDGVVGVWGWVVGWGGMTIKMVSVLVDDPIKAFKYYTETLGFVEKMYMPEMRLAIVVSAEEPEGTALMLEPNANLGAKAFYDGIYKAGLPVIVFGSKDIQKDYERLKEKGVIFRKPPTKTEWGTLAVFEDQNGNLIQLHQG